MYMNQFVLFLGGKKNETNQSGDGDQPGPSGGRGETLLSQLPLHFP